MCLLAAGCIKPQSNGEKLLNAAHEVVTAARFGRMDVVLARVRPDARERFASDHAEWGTKVRILDIEYGGATPFEEKKALVLMGVAWTRPDETIVRSTTLKQTWEFVETDWVIISEEVTEGDTKLLTQPPPKDVVDPRAAP